LSLPMPVRIVEADERVDAVRGCVAVERGPLVFAVEQVDQADDVAVDDLHVDPALPTSAEHRPDLLTGVTVVTAQGRAGRHVNTDWPYQQAGQGAVAEDGEDVQITAVPYFTWANRGIAPMRVWLPRTEA
jgi:uncharacterized protein